MRKTKRMNKLEEIENEASNQNIEIKRTSLPLKISAIYYDNGISKPLIALNNLLRTTSEQCCVIAEELGHYHTSYGNLLTDPEVDNTIIRQQETRAKRWAVKKLVTIKNIIKAYEAGAANFYEMAEYLDVTEEFLRNAFKAYNQMYGKYKKRGNYIIYFDPPGVLKQF